MTIRTAKGAFAAALATGGTFTVSYPQGYDRGSFQAGAAFKFSAIGKVFVAPDDFTISLGATTATVTYTGATTIPAGSSFTFEFDQNGSYSPFVIPGPNGSAGAAVFTPLRVGLLELGSPGASAADAILLSAAITAAAGVSVFTGALGRTLDARTGRNVVAAWTGAAVMTVTGKDMYGRKLVEASASGTSFTGKKAFKTITSITVSADVTAATVGTGNVLGLPVFLSSASFVLKELQDNVAATAGTIVLGSVATKPTATSNDTRGTYTPNAAPDGLKSFALISIVQDDNYLGATHFTG